MKRICFALVGIVAVFLVAGCFGGETETGLENERRSPTSGNSPQTKQYSGNPAEANRSAPERVEAKVAEDGLHLEVGRYGIDAPRGVAPVGTTVEVVAFQRDPSEVARTPEAWAGVDLRRLSSKSALEGADKEVALEGRSSGVSLENTGRGFTIDVPDGIKLEKPIQVSFSGDEYTSSLQDMGANDPAPVFLRDQADGLVWGATALSDPEEDKFTATLTKVGTFYEAAFSIGYNVGDVLTDVADRTFAKRTPQPSCHGQPIEAPDGGTITAETSGGAVWACLDSEGDRVFVSLTNNYPAPLIVDSEPAAPFKLTSRKSAQDALVTAYGDYRDEVVLPIKGKAELYYPVDSLPGTIELSTNYELAHVGFLGPSLDAAGGPFDSVALKRLLKIKGGAECLESIVLEDYLEATIDCGTLASKKSAKLIFFLFVAGDVILGYAGQIMENYNGPFTVTINHEPGSNDASNSRFQETWTGQVTEFDEDDDPVSKYQIEANIAPVPEMTEASVGEVVGQVSYSLGCGGVWTLKEANANSVQVKEKIKRGTGNCVEFTVHTLTPQPDGSLRYYFPSSFNGYTGKGVLTRQVDGTPYER